MKKKGAIMSCSRKEQNHRYYLRHRTERTATNKRWHAEHPNYSRRYYAEHSARENARIRRWKLGHPEAKRAHGMVQNALRKGLIRKSPYCQLCLQETRLQAHHPDYTQPLEVIWLCSACHVAVHTPSCIEAESMVYYRFPQMTILQFPPRCEACGGTPALEWHWVVTVRQPKPAFLCWECNIKRAEEQALKMSIFQKNTLFEELRRYSTHR